jgi:glycosyltransferase involved in cell wall biosynthesis
MGQPAHGGDADGTGESALPTMAVLMPAWNAQAWIGQALRSVIDQAYPKLEIIVVDDGSTDGTREVVAQFEDVSLYAQTNRGAPAARNHALALARAETVLFLDADDYLAGRYLRGLAEAYARERPDLVVGRLMRELGGKLVAHHAEHLQPDPVVMLRGVITHGIHTSQVLWNRSHLLGLGGWREGLARGQDFELALRAVRGRPKVAFSQEGYWPT